VKQQGISLIELMISLFLACLLLPILIQHYANCKQQYLYSEYQLEQAMDVQLVTELVRDSIRRAGFTPCLRIDYLTTIDRRDDLSQLSALKIDKAPSHGLRIQRMGENFMPVIQVIGTNQLLIAGANFNRHQPILLADCFHAEVQEIINIEQQDTNRLLTLKYPLAFTYHLPFYIGEWIDERFFIQVNQQGVPALFYQTLRAEELTCLINRLLVQIYHLNEETRVDVTLGLKQRDIIIKTQVRA
jgi:hypothetical protein